MVDYTKLNGLIVNEFSKSQCTNWFDMTYKKFLHNIDTFYYSVNLHNDFSKETNDISVLNMRTYFTRYENESFDYCEPIQIKNCSTQLNYRNFTFSGYYQHCIECPDTFDIFIAESVPTDITSEIIVQLRSQPLWLNGTCKAFEDSYDVVKAICKMFDLDIAQVKENRIDFCWHTNAIQNPETYFRIDNFAEMQVSRFKRIHYEYNFRPNNEYENDYICLGRRSDKCFVRIYLKSKEVIEKGYKPWFIKMWLLNGLINRYDYYVYTNLFETGNWNHLDIMRLQFYSEYGSDEFYKNECFTYIQKLATTGTVDYDQVHKLADKLTPKVTLITNVEFQTTRKSSKSYVLIENPANEKYKECKRIYDYFDNRRMITDYLTHSTLRLVDISTDVNKSRCDYVQFWNLLRNCKQIDVRISKRNDKLIRDYSRDLNKKLIKTKMLNSAMTYSLYCKGINDDEVQDDIVNALIKLNDNDLYNMRNYKHKRKKQLNNIDFTNTLEDISTSFKLFDTESGELL